MPNLVPGFIWHPIDVSGRAKRSKGRGLIAHVAVSESANLVPPGTPATRSADWHFYLPKSGPGIQYIDLDYQCWSSAGANATCPAFESQGGVTSPQTEPWTPNQIELAAQILAHLHRTEGTPLQVMPNSLPSSKGIGPHRWGINPWRVAGGEVWSSSNGKVCPGDAKVAQLPQIVARATQIVNGAVPTPPPIVQEDDMRLIQHADRGIAAVGPGYFQTLTPAQLTGSIATYGNPVVFTNVADFDAVVSASVGGLTRTRDAVWSAPLDGGGNIVNGQPWASTRLAGIDGKTGDLEAKVDALGKVQAPVIDEAKLAAALLADPEAVQALGKAIADNLQLAPRPNS